MLKFRGKFFLSIASAVFVGILFAIFIINIREILSISSIDKKALYKDEEGEELDQTFISDFSRVLIYSSKDNIREGVKDNFDSYFISRPSSKISAISYLIYDMDKRKIILAKNLDKVLPIASLTKLATAVIAIRLIDKDQKIEITEDMLKTQGDSGGLFLWERLSRDELLYPLLMTSSNDAAEALASYYGRREFIKKMNDWARSIGAKNTNFYDPSGLSPRNTSTARDISIMSEWIQNNQREIFDITDTKTKMIRTHTWTNPTKFLNLRAYSGGKNGYIPESGLTSLELFSIGSPKKLYSIVLLGSKDRADDTLSILSNTLK